MIWSTLVLGLLWIVNCSEGKNYSTLSFLEQPLDLQFLNTFGGKISCLVSGQPRPIVTWVSEDGKDLSPIPDLLSISGNTLIFHTFTGAQLQNSIHNTTIRCKATNEGGSIISRTVRITAEIDVRFSPVVHHQSTVVGSQAIFKCNIPVQQSSFVKLYGWYVTQDEKTNTNPPLIRPGTNQIRRAVLNTGELFLKAVSMSDDLSKFSCVARNILNNVTIQSSPALLYVIDPPEDFSPESVIRPLNQEANFGTSITLPCLASSYPLPKYMWLKDGFPLSNIKVKQLNGGSIQIPSLQQSDSGKYTCIINHDKIYKFDAVVKVLEPLKLTEFPVSVYTSPDNIVNFKCSATGTKPIQITWYRNGDVVKPSTRISLSSNSHVLTVKNLVQSDDGFYQCYVSNGYEEISASAQLFASSSLPIIVNDIKDRILENGTDAKFNCTYNGPSSTKVSWWFEGMTLNYSREVFVTETIGSKARKTSILTLKNVRSEMTGSYQCIIQSQAGRDIKKFHVGVNGKPKIYNFKTSVHAEIGKSLLLHCQSRGYPASSYTWLDERNKRISSDMRFTIYNNNSLLVKGVKNAEKFKCQAANKFGKDDRTVTIINLYERPSISTIDFAPKVAGNRETLLCSCRKGSKEGISVAWFKDGVNVKNIKGIEVTQVDSFTILLIFPSVNSDHRGRYTCVAENIVGKSTFSGNLIVLEKATFQTSPTDTSVLFGSSAKLQCIATGFPQPQIVWYKKNKNTDFQRLHLNHRIKQLDNGELYISKSLASDRGVYYCEAVFSEKSLETSKTNEINLEVKVPAKVVSTSSTMLRDGKGNTTSLTCSVIGTPQLRVKWLKESVRLSTEETDKYKYLSITKVDPLTNESQLISTLLINNLSRYDNAEYECKAMNTYGSDKQYFRVLVEEIPDKPHSIEKTSSTSHSISFSWKLDFNGNLPVLRYYIHVIEDEGRAIWDGEKIYMLQGNSTTYTVNGLRAGTFYKFRVRAHNQIGDSEYSTTKIMGTNEKVPSGPPLNISLKAVAKDKIQINWQSPAKELRNGIIVRYAIFYTHTSRLRTPPSKNTIKTNTNSFTISGLFPFTEYKIQLSAITKIGMGPLSKPYYATTLEGVPSKPPTGVQIQTMTSRKIFVSWNDIPELYRNGKLLGYVVKYTSTKEGLKSQVNVKNKLNVMLPNLKTFTKYQITVMGETKVGLGTPSETYEAWTFEDVPGKPTLFKAIPANPNEIVLTWKPPVEANGIILHYIVYYKEYGAKNNKKIEVSPKDRSFNVKNLEVRQRYIFKMAAQTSVGEGNTTIEVIASTTEHVPATIITPEFYTVYKPIGSDVSLPCTAVGFPKPVISWQSKHKYFNKGRRWMPTDKPKLLYHISKEAEGEYICRASNSYGEDKNVVILRVQVPPASPVNIIAQLNGQATASKTKQQQYSLNVMWTAGSDGNSKILRHHLYYAVKEKDSQWVIATVPSDQYRFQIDNITYMAVFFKMASQNGIGLGEFSKTYKFDIVPPTLYNPATVHVSEVTNVFGNPPEEKGTLQRLLKPILISLVAILTLLIVLLLVASWDREERRITGPKCHRLICSCPCRSRKNFGNDPYGEPGLLWPWDAKRNRHNVCVDWKDELLPRGSPQDEHIEMKKYRNGTALSYTTLLDQPDEQDGGIRSFHGNDNGFRTNDYEPVVLFTPSKTPDSHNFASVRNHTANNSIRTASSIDRISRTSSGRHPKHVQSSLSSEQSILDKYLNSQSEEYDTDNYFNRYIDENNDATAIGSFQRDDKGHPELYSPPDDVYRDQDSRGSADGKPIDLPKYDELYGEPVVKPSPPPYQGYCDYSDAPRALFRSDGSAGSTKRKKNRKSLDSLMLKTLEDIEEQGVLNNTSDSNTPALERHAAIVRDALRDATRSYDSVSSTCSSSVGELRRAFEFGKKYGLQKPMELPAYLHDSLDDLTNDDADYEDEDDDFLERDRLLLEKLNLLTNFSEMPRSVNDIKVKIPLPIRLNESSGGSSDDPAEESEYGKDGIPALSLV